MFPKRKQKFMEYHDHTTALRQNKIFLFRRLDYTTVHLALGIEGIFHYLLGVVLCIFLCGLFEFFWFVSKLLRDFFFQGMIRFR
jgi:hypothetical protein